MRAERLPFVHVQHRWGTQMNEQKLESFFQKLVNDLGAAFSIAPVRIGGALGLYPAMAQLGRTSSTELATATGLAERYVREWLWHQAASGYIEYDAQTTRFTLPPEHAFLLADPQSPAYVIPGFDAAAALSENMQSVMHAFRTGEGVAWAQQAGCIACAIAEFFRPGYRTNLIESWLPALDGLFERLKAGALVADVGCGHGHTTILMAKTFPNSHFIGIDPHEPSIEAARLHAASHADIENLTFAVGSAQELEGEFDFVTCFDCLHDMGDPIGAAQRIRKSLRSNGSWMIVEPFAHDEPEKNFTPIGRMSYAASTMTCVPGALAQKGGVALGAQAGEFCLREVIMNGGGFSRVRRVAETPLNMVLEATL
jgi:2-polyprenyl-3-methyl-5-hydroxy-6-metoxy-1,4-benzoquinol methylase